MIDPYIALSILLAGLVIGTLVHSLYPYAGRAALLTWILMEIGLFGWYFWQGGTIFFYTVVVTALPLGVLLLVLGLPFEVVRRKRMKARGDAIRSAGGFACPHCGYQYDREKEDNRCPDCGGAADGAPGVLT